ncbi:MAG: asparagine synthase (glutamine-hydrolyzing) [Cyclobacteriaceae bacterium]
MCGITGVFAFNEVGRINQMYLANATQAISKRGPDFQDFYIEQFIGLGHRRLAIIDTSEKGNQPMTDETGRYVLLFNGEIYNYKELRKRLIDVGYSFNSESDTEVLLKLYIQKGEACLKDLNGFFALAIFDKKKQELFLARDRMGIKPLLYTHDNDRFIFASEMKSIMAYGVKKEIDYTSLYTYLQLNYIPNPKTIFKDVLKCPPGHFIKVANGTFEIKSFYEIPADSNMEKSLSYESAQNQLVALLEKSVQRRLVADVPLGAFLSGGIDSSSIVALASRHVEKLNTFSIGYADEPFFDETSYADEVSKKFNTHHEVFKLTNQDLYQHLDEVVNYIDEPFADSSALPVYILSKETRNHVTVALSGDGADEIFSGYNKHYALSRSLQDDLAGQLVSAFGPLWKLLPKSRAGKTGNLIRQLHRFSVGKKLTPQDRYWLWAAFNSENQAADFLSSEAKSRIGHDAFRSLKSSYLNHIPDNPTLTDFLLADTKLVLANDMLTKVDMMSMANSLEVRVPFLDHEVVEFAFTLPDEYKIDGKIRKRIVQDAFREILPQSLYRRPKHGFEVPLLKWFRNELKGDLDRNLFNQKLIEDQGIFNWPTIRNLRGQLHSLNPSDAHAKTWALYVFQRWFKNYM